MTDPGVYLEKLSAFSRMLRLEGFSIGPSETADAGKILIALGMEDRQQVKTALRTVYAKTREEQLNFDRVFDSFFLSEEAMRQQARDQMQREAEEQLARHEAQQALKERGVELNDEETQVFSTLSESQRQRLLDLAKKYRGNDKRNPKLYSSFIHSVFAKALLEQQLLMEDAGYGCEAADPELGLMYRDISQFSDTEIPKAISIIQTVSRQVGGELTARKKRTGHSGSLDFRRTIRKGLETGGSFYRLRYRKKPRHKKHLVLLCDVSGSMIQFSEFALRFIQNLNQISESSRVFLFSEELYEADPFSLQNMDLFRSYVKQCGIYGKGTDLGSALEKLTAMQPASLNQATTLLILSDTKTIDQPRAINALLDARRLAGRVIWMNPIPQQHWKHIRSIQAMNAICPMVCCSTLRDLANACRRLTMN